MRELYFIPTVKILLYSSILWGIFFSEAFSLQSNFTYTRSEKVLELPLFQKYTSYYHRSCSENFMISTLESNYSHPCKPVSSTLNPKFEGISLIGIDASFNNDAFSLSTAEKYFFDNKAYLYKTISPGTAPGKGVLRINSSYLFDNKKAFFIFINEKANISNYKQKELIESLQDMYPQLDDIRIFSFERLRSDLEKAPRETDVGRLFYYLGDCQLKSHGGCSTKLYSDGRFHTFSQEMIRDDIDVLFVVPAVMERFIYKKNTARSIYYPVFGMYKATMSEEERMLRDEEQLAR